jgi:hypothetical protein
MKLWAQLTEWFTKKKTIAGRDRTIQILRNALESEKKVTRLLRQQVSTNDRRVTLFLAANPSLKDAFYGHTSK